MEFTRWTEDIHDGVKLKDRSCSIYQTVVGSEGLGRQRNRGRGEEREATAPMFLFHPTSTVPPFSGPLL